MHPCVKNAQVKDIIYTDYLGPRDITFTYEVMGPDKYRNIRTGELWCHFASAMAEPGTNIVKIVKAAR